VNHRFPLLFATSMVPAGNAILFFHFANPGQGDCISRLGPPGHPPCLPATKVHICNVTERLQRLRRIGTRRCTAVAVQEPPRICRAAPCKIVRLMVRTGRMWVCGFFAKALCSFYRGKRGVSIAFLPASNIDTVFLSTSYNMAPPSPFLSPSPAPFTAYRTISSFRRVSNPVCAGCHDNSVTYPSSCIIPCAFNS
jgi:hypothetical protein